MEFLEWKQKIILWIYFGRYIYSDINNKWCDQVDYFENNFANWTSGNKEIDNLIQEMQLNIRYYYDTVFEWIPYDQFSNIKEVDKSGFTTIYSAIWKDGPLKYDIFNKKRWIAR